MLDANPLKKLTNIFQSFIECPSSRISFLNGSMTIKNEAPITMY